jgi:hypothetical protein
MIYIDVVRIPRFLVNRIVALNTFGCPVSSLATHKDCLTNKTKEENPFNSCGIWTQASYINHSCMNTAHRAFIGDLMIVRASRDLEPGTEITFWYHSPISSDVKAVQKKLEHWGFVCDCALCLDFRKTKAAVILERQKLLENMKRAFEGPCGIQIDKVERLLGALDRTYTRRADEVPRLLLWDPQLALTRAYAAQKNMIKTLDSSKKVLASLGFIVVGADSSPTSFAVIKWGLIIDHLVETFLSVRTAFAAMGVREDSRHAEQYARTTYNILVGEEASFDAMYGS